MRQFKKGKSGEMLWTFYEAFQNPQDSSSAAKLMLTYLLLSASDRRTNRAMNQTSLSAAATRRKG